MSRLFDRPMDIFIDLTADGEVGRRTEEAWPHPDRFTARARRVTCVVRPGTVPALSKAVSSLGWTLLPSSSAIAACSEAMRRAAEDGASLLLLHGRVEASDEAVFAMRQSLERDPMFGCAAARIRCADGCCFRRPSRSGLAAGPWIPRRALADVADVAEVEICPELFESSLLFPPEIVGEFGTLDTRFASLPGAILHYLSCARRCGYRTVLSNRAVMGICGVSCDDRRRPGPAVLPSDEALLHQLTPELNRGWEEFRAESNERFERLSAHVHRTVGGERRGSLLLDIRNVGALHNGTSRAVLGCVEALHRLSPPWEVSVLVQPSAIPFHGLGKSWPGWELTTTVPRAPFTAALRLSQPWHIQEMIDLHQVALFNMYFVLDTISWDVVYPPPRRLDGTWSFLADHADGLLFDSAFTERRFLARFGRAAEAPRTVCHYPFDPADYVDRRATTTATSDYMLVVGNELDHKDAVRTIELLSTVFPFRPVVSLGPQLSETPYLRVHRAGSLSEHDVGCLYAEARFVIFPSLYEGFGFPIVTALALGKTLIARKSELLDEIAARCSTGRLIAFTRRDELADILGRLFHGEAVQEEPLGAAISGAPRRWPDVARDIMAFTEQVTGQPARSNWLSREHAVNQLLAYRT